MNFAQRIVMFCILLSLGISAVEGAPAHTVKGVVVTPDGTVVPEFSVIIRRDADKPQLIPRKHFTDGEFTITGLAADKYQLQISAPQFVSAGLTFDFKSDAAKTDYRIVILHPYRNEIRASSSAGYSVSLKVLQQKIPADARKAYEDGVNFHREGKLNEAMIEYGKALRKYPQYIQALTDIGSILLLYNRPESALTFLRRAEDVDHSNPVIKLNIAVALTEQRDFGGALKLLKDVLEKDPHTGLAQYYIAKIRYMQKKYDESEEYTHKALENDPGLLEAWVLLINISLEQKNYDETREALARVREAMSNKTVTRFIDEQLSVLGI